MTRPSLAGIEKRVAAATEGPWEAHEGTVGAMTGPRGCGGCSGLVSPRHEPACFWSEVAGAAPADAAFIAAARTAVPALTAAVRDVLALHAPAPVYAYIDDCGHPDDGDHGIEVMCGEYVCPDTPTGDVLCLGCGLDEDQDPTPYPCETVRALTAHLDLTDPEGDPT